MASDDTRGLSGGSRTDSPARPRAGRGDDASARQHLGRAGEDVAAAHLERLGYDVIERNHRTRFGELDLIAFDGETIVFCEVKTRRAGARVSTWDALSERKQGQVRRIAAAWLAETPGRPFGEDLRFDAIGVEFDARGELVRLDHLEGAF
jgi:putative endonuclease